MSMYSKVKSCRTCTCWHGSAGVF